MSDVDVDRDEDSPQPQHNTLNNVGSPVKHYQHHSMEEQVENERIILIWCKNNFVVYLKIFLRILRIHIL